ncbi:GNAT family N-acetyltransferase [Candidatus Woesearchaeota archaeon]|nr:GNAT family N-acetyltransferase [Candidatus Woesearchaeota archaeon]
MVVPEYRERGIAKQLYQACEQQLREQGINYIYGWANAHNPIILELMKKQGFSPGHEYIWMDKKL